jgi:tripartite-type tricarboxylate transporter receptor subunit TctC
MWPFGNPATGIRSAFRAAVRDGTAVSRASRGGLAGLACGLALLAAAGAHAQTYPTRPIRIIVPLAPGGGTDLVTRVIAQKLSEQMGVSVIVDNRGGAGTVIGTELLSKAPADGYTLGTMPAEFTPNPSLRKLPYDTLNDFGCIIQMTSGQFLLSTHPSVPVKTVRQLVALARARPGQLTFASSGIASANHLAVMLFQQLTDTKVIHVPYKSGGQANTALLGGETDFLFSNTASAIPHVKSGKLRAIATTGPRRSLVAPQIPTVAESGVPKFVVTGFYLLVGRAGLPAGIAATLNAEVTKALGAADVRARLAEYGAEPAGGTPEACTDLIRAELVRWEPLVKASGAARE